MQLWEGLCSILGYYFILYLDIWVQWNLSQFNVIGFTNCVWDKQVLRLHRLTSESCIVAKLDFRFRQDSCLFKILFFTIFTFFQYEKKMSYKCPVLILSPSYLLSSIVMIFCHGWFFFGNYDFIFSPSPSTPSWHVQILAEYYVVFL